MLKRAFMTMAAAAAVTAALTFGAAAAENEKIQAGGLVFEIPAEYKDLVTVQTEGLQPDELIRVSETASIEAAKANGEDREGAGWLFSISRIPENELKRLRCGDMSGSEVFAEADDVYYLYNHPTDVRLVRESYDDIESKLGSWTELNEWAGRDVVRDTLANNPQLDAEQYSNTMLDIYLAQAAFEGRKYEIRSLELLGTQPAVCDGNDFLEELTEDVWYEPVTDLSEQEQPDGEYIVMAFDDDGVRFDFFLGQGMENYIREVRTMEDGETIETLYRAHFDDADESSTGIMKEWIAELLHGDYDDDDDDDFDD